MTPFRERNKTVIGSVGLVVIVLLLVVAFSADKLPIIGGGTVYQAQFSEAAGLRPNDWRLLAFYAWETDQQQAVPASSSSTCVVVRLRARTSRPSSWRATGCW